MQSQLLKAAFPLVRTHGFTRQALSDAALHIPKPHPEPLSETAVTALFGSGENARRTLLSAWLEEGRNDMETCDNKDMSSILKHRLRWNEPALHYLPEAFALLASPTSGIPPLDPRPVIQHAASVADQAWFLSGDKSTGNEWYAKRAAISAVYAAAELHQIGSPATAVSFLEDLLNTSRNAESALSDTIQFARYTGRACKTTNDPLITNWPCMISCSLLLRPFSSQLQPTFIILVPSHSPSQLLKMAPHSLNEAYTLASRAIDVSLAHIPLLYIEIVGKIAAVVFGIAIVYETIRSLRRYYRLKLAQRLTTNSNGSSVDTPHINSFTPFVPGPNERPQGPGVERSVSNASESTLRPLLLSANLNQAASNNQYKTLLLPILQHERHRSYQATGQSAALNRRSFPFAGKRTTRTSICVLSEALKAELKAFRSCPADLSRAAVEIDNDLSYEVIFSEKQPITEKTPESPTKHSIHVIFPGTNDGHVIPDNVQSGDIQSREDGLDRKSDSHLVICESVADPDPESKSDSRQQDEKLRRSDDGSFLECVRLTKSPTNERPKPLFDDNDKENKVPSPEMLTDRGRKHHRSRPYSKRRSQAEENAITNPSTGESTCTFKKPRIVVSKSSKTKKPKACILVVEKRRNKRSGSDTVTGMRLCFDEIPRNQPRDSSLPEKNRVLVRVEPHMNPAPTSQEGGKESQTTNLKELVVVECPDSVPKKRSRELMKKVGAKKVSRPENGSGPKEKEKGRKGNSIRAPLGVITNTNSNQLRDTPETKPEPKVCLTTETPEPSPSPCPVLLLNGVPAEENDLEVTDTSANKLQAQQINPPRNPALLNTRWAPKPAIPPLTITVIVRRQQSQTRSISGRNSDSTLAALTTKTKFPGWTSSSLSSSMSNSDLTPGEPELVLTPPAGTSLEELRGIISKSLLNKKNGTGSGLGFGGGFGYMGALRGEVSVGSRKLFLPLLTERFYAQWVKERVKEDGKGVVEVYLRE